MHSDSVNSSSLNPFVPTETSQSSSNISVSVNGHKINVPGAEDAHGVHPEAVTPPSSKDPVLTELSTGQAKTAEKVDQVSRETLNPEESPSLVETDPGEASKFSEELEKFEFRGLQGIPEHLIPADQEAEKAKIIAQKLAALDKPRGDSKMTPIQHYGKASTDKLPRTDQIAQIKRGIEDDKAELEKDKKKLNNPKNEKFKERISARIADTEERIKGSTVHLKYLEGQSDAAYARVNEATIRDKITQTLDLLKNEKDIFSGPRVLEFADELDNEVIAIVSPVIRENGQIDLDIRITVEEMGRGGFSVVHQAVDLNSDEPIVIKDIDIENQRDEKIKEQNLDSILNEMTIIKQLDGIKGVVNTHDVVQNSENGEVKHVYFVQECCLHGDVHGKELGTEAGRALLETMVEFEDKGILHRDIKPKNIFKKPDGSILLGDFGCCAKISDKTRASDNQGTLMYASPEQANYMIGVWEPIDEGVGEPTEEGVRESSDQGVRKPIDAGDGEPIDKEVRKPIDHKADVYTTALTLNQMHGGTTDFPFEGIQEWIQFAQTADKRDPDIRKKFVTANESRMYLAEPHPTDKDYDFKKLLCDMMQYDSANRPSFAKALERYNQIYPTSK